jgi:hypothetical protein
MEGENQLSINIGDNVQRRSNGVRFDLLCHRHWMMPSGEECFGLADNARKLMKMVSAAKAKNLCCSYKHETNSPPSASCCCVSRKVHRAFFNLDNEV